MAALFDKPHPVNVMLILYSPNNMSKLVHLTGDYLNREESISRRCACGGFSCEMACRAYSLCISPAVRSSASSLIRGSLLSCKNTRYVETLDTFIVKATCLQLYVTSFDSGIVSTPLIQMLTLNRPTIFLLEYLQLYSCNYTRQ